MYHQSQDTRAGVHAYSYAGGPSAKEEVRGLDGVTRGSYSYVDAHGIPQSVFYVADEGGFRVAATNLPTDGNTPLGALETGEVLLAKYAHSQGHAKATAAREEVAAGAASRRKRSAEASADQDRHRAENPSSQGDRADRNSAAKSSHELPAQREKSEEGRANPVLAPVYGLLDSVLIPRLTGAATSHQSRVDVHNNIRLKAAQPIEAVGVLPEPVYGTVILPSRVALATSHQSRVQLHNNLRVVPEEIINVETLEVQPEAVKLELVSALPDYNENRIQLHKNLGLEGPNRKDAVKIDVGQPVIVESPIAAVPVVAKKALPVVTAVSNQSRIQIHRNTKLEVAVPSEPVVYWANSYVRPITTWPFLAPIAQSSQYRYQIHSNDKLELPK